jgi:hypothetical protein
MEFGTLTERCGGRRKLRSLQKNARMTKKIPQSLKQQPKQLKPRRLSPRHETLSLRLDLHVVSKAKARENHLRAKEKEKVSVEKVKAKVRLKAQGSVMFVEVTNTKAMIALTDTRPAQTPTTPTTLRHSFSWRKQPVQPQQKKSWL